MREQAEKFGTRYIQANVTAVDFKQRPFTLTLSDDSVVKAKAVIIATGAVAKWLNAPGKHSFLEYFINPQVTVGPRSSATTSLQVAVLRHVYPYLDIGPAPIHIYSPAYRYIIYPHS
jgi:hypothetical protein